MQIYSPFEIEEFDFGQSSGGIAGGNIAVKLDFAFIPYE